MSFKTRDALHFCSMVLFLLAIMVEEDESSRVRMANQPVVLAGYWPLLTALNRFSTILCGELQGMG